MTDREKMVCTGCGNAWTDEELREMKKRDPRIISCCPERDMKRDHGEGSEKTK